MDWSLILGHCSLSFLQLLKVHPSTITYSFLSDFATGLGSNDYEGLIEQPIMDQEVISIGGSSSEDTH